MPNLLSSIGILVRLKELDLSNCGLEQIDKITFHKLRLLKILDMSQNYLTDLPNSLFHKSNITKLNLSYNRYEELPYALFSRGPEVLSILNVTVEEPLWNLETLEASQVNITTLLPQDLEFAPNLLTLRMSGSNIVEVLPGTLKNLSSLNLLDLSQNQLLEFPKERLKGLLSLKTLNLSHNALSELDHFPPSMINLKTVDISRNMITELKSGTFKEAKFLDNLHLEENAISKLHSKSFAGLHKLKFLDLSYNNLEEMNPKVLLPVERRISDLKLMG
ncbi:Insulin-like growth factor-binding protein complex acid labile subunit, partial [Armadillidium nasatum]